MLDLDRIDLDELDEALLPIEPLPSSEGYNDTADSVDRVTERRAADLLARAIEGPGALYGDRLVQVVVYGSRARGDNREDSDPDLLIALDGVISVSKDDARASIGRAKVVVDAWLAEQE